MIKGVVCGLLSAAVMLSVTYGAAAQSFSVRQTAAIDACSAAGLQIAGGADCALALCSLQAGEYPPIAPVLLSGAGTAAATLSEAQASCNIETGAIDDTAPPVAPTAAGDGTSPNLGSLSDTPGTPS